MVDNQVKEDPARIALFMPSMAGGGAERVMLTLGQAFVACGFRVDLIVLQAEGELLNELPTGVNMVTLRASRPRSSIWPLQGYLRRSSPLVLLSALSQLNWVACLATRLAGSRTRCIVTEVNQLSLVLKTLDGPSRWLRPKLLRWSCSQAQHLAVSKGSARDLSRVLSLPETRVQAVYNPVIDRGFYERAAEPVDHPWFRNAGAPVILAVGRLHEQKGFDVLLEAFARVQEKSQACLLILGEGPQRSALEAHRQKLGLDSRVSLPGFVPNPLAYMSKAAVFVLSSRREGLGNVVIEALACGAQVVATDCESGPSEILDGGRFGKLVRPNDPDALADALLATLSDEHQKHDPTHWLNQFTVDTVVDRYLDIMGLPKCSADPLEKSAIDA